MPVTTSMARPRKTLADLQALPDETPAELIRGELCMTPSPSKSHQDAVLALGSLLRTYGRQSKAGRAYVAPLDVYLASGDVVQPDVLFVRTGNPALAEDGVHGVPDLVVEILSPSHPLHDRIVKRDLYAKNGVPEYWILDPLERTIEIFALDGEAYRPAGYGREGQALVSPTFEGLTIAVADAFS